MSRRKREVQRRKKQAEEALEKDGHREVPTSGPVEPGVEPSREAAPRERTVATGSPEGRSPTAAPRARSSSKKKTSNRKPAQVPTPAAGSAGVSWLAGSRENILLGLLVVYVLLLGLGTAGELFEIEWILNLPLFK